MPGLLFHQGPAATCPHAGPVTVSVPGQARVRVSGQFVTTMGAVNAVTGCPVLPTPCASVVWANLSSRVKAAGQPVLLYEAALGPGNGATVGTTPGPPIGIAVQPRVRGV